jgi:formylglycine-generating enzyme required for sulfatase activity
LNEYGWHLGNSGMRTHDVGTKLPNGWGLLDMHGNVFEWCADDWHFSYDGAPIDGAAWIDRPRGDRRVARGGAWGDPPENLRCANRYGLRASERPGPVGFRLARSIPTR